MSGNDRSERAFAELETLVRNLGDELGVFRRRALLAESQLKESSRGGKGAGSGPLNDRLAEIETENAALRSRVESAEERVKQLLERLRFLRQQLQTQPIVVGRS